MKILHVVGRMNVGGAEVFLMNLFRNIDRSNYEFIFLCYFEGSYDFEDEITALGGKIIRIKDNRLKNPFKFILDIKKVARQEKVDVVHSHVDFTSGYALLAAWLAGVQKRIAHAHNSSATDSTHLLRVPLYFLLKIFLNVFSTYKLACGDDAGRYFYYRGNDFEVIPNGIDLSNYVFNRTVRHKIREQLGLSADARVLLHVGRFEKQKNHIFLLDIVKHLQGERGEYVLVLVGDGSLKLNIKEYARQNGILDKVLFVGKTMDVASFYSAADVFVFPSLYEGLGIVAVEAQANGLFVVASTGVERAADVGGVSFVPLEASLSEWSENIVRVATAKRQKYPKINIYDIHSVSKKMEGIYEQQ